MGFALVACATDRTPDEREGVGHVSSALFTNGGFETGAAGATPTGWTVATFLNDSTAGGVNGITVQTPQTYAGLNLGAGGRNLTSTLAATNATDPDLGAAASLRVCRYGTKCARVNFHSSNNFPPGNGQNVNILSQTMTVAAGDVDPSDGQIHVRFTFAPVLQNPAHTASEQPYYFILVDDLTKGTTLHSDFNLSGGTAGLTWSRFTSATLGEIDYTDWQLVDVSGAGGAIAQGDSVELRVIGAGCWLGGHFGEVYVDGVGPTIPGLSVEGTAPAQANAGTNITYTLSYKNGSAATAAAETGVVITFPTPPNTTFQSITAPVGATCTTPAVGAAGTVTCTFSGSMASGTSGTFGVTVAIAAGTTGTITEANYSIHSTQETTLLGPPIVTRCGCTQDSNCPSGQWCNESASTCTATLANGTALPTDGSHTNPTLNGTCTTAAGTLVCTSKVCDTADNECGYANGDGSCTATNGGTVCRSGTCSSNGKCEPAGGCNVDADCTGGKWCNETSHTCTATLANGSAVPTDGAHTNPTLNGTCTAAAGALVCTSGVCDTADNDCGYANGDGPCTAANGTTVCRSGACSTNGTCVPAGGCNVDADCTTGNWCNETTHVCTAKVANGGALPTDGAHTNPTLNGTCTTAAGALVCTSGVCDTADNECGYANGDGSCTATNGGNVCRSGSCSASGTCEAAGGCAVDADCASSQYCDESAHTCTPKVANGSPVPTDPGHTNPTLDGTCTAAAGAVACASGACDKDNSCGLENGDGPCTAGDGGASAVCRSGLCASPGDAGATCVACVGDGDCPTGQVCSASNACVVPTIDAGSSDGGLPDGDAGEDAASEAGAADARADAPADAAVADAPLEGAATDATVDAAGEDAAEDSAAGNGDAAEDTGAAHHTNPKDSGYIEGGGCSAAGGRRGGNGVPGSMLGALSVLGALAVRRRRAR